MANNISMTIRQQVIYQVFPRNHSKEGNFQGVISDLQRIRAMGIDILYLLPIHPIGSKNRKGDMGSPYAISDYRKINEEYGTLEDFKELIDKTHQCGMKLMMDVVLNHTAPDHSFVETHPDYYYRREDGSFGNKVGDWSDIIDLDYANKELWTEMIETLTYFAGLGIDGYRCDVASFVPVAFWLEARREVANINPEFIWLAESVHKEFLQYYRNQGNFAYSDSELYQAFDICYDYDIHTEWTKCIQGTIGLDEYASMLNLQEAIYPMNYSKLRFMENHDQPRIVALCGSKTLTNQWVAFSFFEKGTAFVYAGQESWATKQPSLFTKDLIDLSVDTDYMQRLSKLSSIKKLDIIANHTSYEVRALTEYVMMVEYRKVEERLIGFFGLTHTPKENRITTELADGEYTNLIDQAMVVIKGHQLSMGEVPIILHIK